MDYAMIAILVMLGIMFLSRTLNENANKKLDQDKKAELVDLFSKDRIYNFGILIIIISIFFINIKLNLIDQYLNYGIYIGSVVIFMIVSTYLSFRKLKKNNFPDSYIKSYITVTTIRFLGIVIFFAIYQMG
ncbi:MAG: hypothetical protein J7604_23415 [Sporocytophaga sp.]|uniref:hypothetical protein n=1 Tax=Sporocytophaga sp. TaxID=2231183 RepID=UPI001B1CBECD|nr:hypothetical protein [Sporocytophaga sp.]MBO9703183.1 hypothetical protein [Sporocytophaga sp.]